MEETCNCQHPVKAHDKVGCLHLVKVGERPNGHSIVRWCDCEGL